MALPVGEVAPVFADAAPPARPGEAGSTILIVDDEAEIRDDARRHPERRAASRRDRDVRARGAAAHGCRTFDVILTDIRMPDLDGRALYQAIERRWPGRAGRVVFVTGDTLASGLREFVDASGRPVIEKPFMPGEVRRVVAEVASGAASRDAPLPPDDHRQATQSKQE